MNLHSEVDEKLLAYKPISITLNFDWENTTYDERVQMRHNYIEEQKKKDPNFVGYDFIEHFSGTSHNVVVIFNRLVSTIGQIFSLVNNKIYISFGGSGEWYRSINLLKNGKSIGIKVHRIVACTFIPIPEHLKEFRNKLVVNHKDDVKYNNLRSNLEWCTQKENIIKAIETGTMPSSSFKFTITRPGKYFGNFYYFDNLDSLIDHGFNPSRVYGFMREGIKYLCGNWETVTKDEIIDKPIGIGKDVIEYIKDPIYGFVSATGSVATILSEGPCKGERFALYGSAQLIKGGFDPREVCKTIKGRRKSYKGCTWERMTREEAVNIPIGLTEAQKEHIFGKK